MAAGEGVDVVDVRRLTAAVGLAVAQGDLDRAGEVLAGADPQTAGAVLIALASAWVRALDLIGEAAGVPDQRGQTLRLLYAEVLEAAGR
ncbi:hypothetical protein [Streptomyces drozdowiczii]|uniref:hypothetical protein n=1 Tax=Streptomyces drozdowiczii TaxID=202862 RepID=UPI00403D176A